MDEGTTLRDREMGRHESGGSESPSFHRVSGDSGAPRDAGPINFLATGHRNAHDESSDTEMDVSEVEDRLVAAPSRLLLTCRDRNCLKHKCRERFRYIGSKLHMCSSRALADKRRKGCGVAAQLEHCLQQNWELKLQASLTECLVDALQDELKRSVSKATKLQYALSQITRQLNEVQRMELNGKYGKTDGITREGQ